MSDDLPISLPEVKSLLWDVTRLTAAVEMGDVKARKDLVVKARSLYMAVETPMEALLRMVWAEVCCWVCNQRLRQRATLESLPSILLSFSPLSSP